MISLLKAASILVALATFSLAANAQSPLTVDAFVNQPGLAQQLQRLRSEQSSTGEQRGTPTSSGAVPANASDLATDENVLFQTQTQMNTEEESTVQQYFRILTGQPMEIFGRKEFSQQQDNQILFFNTVGKNYTLAPGDVVRVTIRGLSQSSRSYQIGLDGNLILDDLAPVPASGSTIQQLEQSILDTLQYDDASASILISLETARLVTVQVSGAVDEPRTLAVPAYTPLSRVLAYSGGVKANGSLRNITLRDANGSVSVIDFYDLLKNPAKSEDPVITNASRIFVPSQGPSVAAFGFVSTPAIYELPPGANKISVQDLLSLSGSNMLPSGVKLEAKFFDADGVPRTRPVDKQSQISAGEVLNLRFVQTSLQEFVSVKGAVLEEYILASSDPVSVRDALKNGAALAKEAKLDFAMIIASDGSAKAINLVQSLQNTSETIPVGGSLVIFDQQSYRQILDADPNATDDPLVAAISQTELAELYLNGERIALMAPNQAQGFSKIVRPYYRLTPETNLDLAVLETKSGNATSVSLRDLLQGTQPFAMAAGMKVHLFETAFLQEHLTKRDQVTGDNWQLEPNARNVQSRTRTKSVTGTPDEATSLKFSQAAPEQEMALVNLDRERERRAATLTNLLSRANVLRVKLDDNLLAVLPASVASQISDIFDVLGIEYSLNDLVDYVEVEIQKPGTRSQTTVRSLSLDYHAPLSGATSIAFWSRDAFKTKLTEGSTKDIKRIAANGLSVYVDYQLEGVFSPKALGASSGPIAATVFDSATYPLFAIIKNFEPETARWQTRVITPQEVAADGVSQLSSNSQIYLFTRDYIKKLLTADRSSVGTQTTQAMPVSPNASGEPSLSNDVAERITSLANSTQKPLNSNATVLADATLLTSYSRFIGGAVQSPGQYPIAGTVSLDQLVDVAGGVLENADLSRVAVQFLKISDGSLVKGQLRTINAREPSGLNFRLQGRYFVEVPALINEVSRGVITLSGEVMQPGQYVFSRTDTLHDIIERAGGLSPVAFPLGAVFSRNSIREAEREYNDLLATQLEEAVLQISTSDNVNAKEQVSAVLGYARQLRTQEPVGRLTVNLSLADANAPLYLEDGDVLKVPQRPAHVTVLGAVNRDTVASYAPGTTMSAYLSSAGGATRLADLRRAYLLLPNGESVPLSRNTVIPPGAAIVVPPKTDRLSILGLTEIVSRVMGNIATSVLAINNVQ